MEATAIHALLQSRFGDAVLDYVDRFEKGSLVAAGRVAEIAAFLRDDPALGFESLMCLTGLDWDGYDASGKGKSVDILGYDELGRPAGLRPRRRRRPGRGLRPLLPPPRPQAHAVRARAPRRARGGLGGRGVADGRLARARGVGPRRDPLRGPPRPEAHPAGRGLGGPPAAQGLRDAGRLAGRAPGRPRLRGLQVGRVGRDAARRREAAGCGNSGPRPGTKGRWA